MAAGNVPSFRLPGDVIPLHYDLEITTELEDKLRFEGIVNISIKCLRPTQVVKVHVGRLNIRKVFVIPKSQSGENSTTEVSDYSIDSTNEFLIVKTFPLVASEVYQLIIHYDAPLTSSLVGYYYSTYKELTTGKSKYLAVTHFEPSDARQAFPCFDEPGYKATFKIKLNCKENLHAVSNMPSEKRYPMSDKPGFVSTEFQMTVPMSTYLVAFMVGDFASVVSDLRPSNTTVRVWSREDARHQTGFPAFVGPNCLVFYEKFFDVEYPLPKLDLIAVPDFKIGAMENWGMITFRESSLLLDENITSSTTKLHIASIIAHEIAHMWFGNLVTMYWWTDLWLKEGFATYMAGLAVNNLFQEWNSLDAEAMSDLLRVFHLDSLKSSHPVSVPIGHSSEISQIFDAISYDKGSFLLRMMHLFLGEEVFQHGVSNYLKKHKFSNAEQDDLWESLTEQAHRYSVLPPELTVKTIMDTWTVQTGYPIITFHRDYANNRANVSQERFLAISLEDKSQNEGSWWVPLSFSTQKEPNFSRTQPENWMSKDQKNMTIDINASSNEWIIVNNRAAGLYKVNYDANNWQLISDFLQTEQFEKIDQINRALLIVDSMDLAYSGRIDYAVAFNLITYMKKEKSFVPWNAALTKLEPIKSKLSRTPLNGVLQDFLRLLLEPIVNTFSLSESATSFEQGRLINLISPWALPLKCGTLIDTAMDLFRQWFHSENPDANNPIPKEVRRTVYSYAVETEGQRAWNFLWQRYKKANIVAEKNNILMALAHAPEVWILNSYLEWTLTSDYGIRKQDAFIIFRMVASREVGFYVAEKFFFRNIQRISEYFGSNSNLIGHYFSAIANQVIYKFELEELKSFAVKHKELLAPASLSVEQGLETAQLNIRWMEQHSQYIGKLMKQNIPSSETHRQLQID